jgi:hypothetical protein
VERHRSLPDVLAGGIFILIGGAFVVGALSYGLGTPLRMGAGYFPLLVGVALSALGLATLVKGLVAGEVPAFGAVPWRAVALVTLAILFFGLTVRRLGFIPTAAVTALLSVAASRRVRPVTALAVTAGLTAASTLIFVVGLQLRIPLWGPWLTF